MKAPAMNHRLELPLRAAPAAPPAPAPAASEPPCARGGWRDDFPIDWPQDEFVARRDFTRFLMLTSFPFALVQMGLAVSNWLRRRDESPEQVIAQLDDVPVGGVVSFNYPGPHDPCLLIRADENTLLAYSQKCTHLGCPVAPEVEQKRFHCPCHHASFDMTTGRPTAGPPRRPLPRVVVENRQGVLYAVGIETTSV